ncbi:PREDICTED: F-box/WD repeat-containing protein pof1-like isoform X2 [Populus euphratica]|uniref:F-box/WD repeat-containing protein pof1-like isoform X2 n=1 Tax=Populus euphratica TaxID=75702 RepID=A0AAJ6TGQ6_POPEU|nr:PREDICTED: F-box/WD repeat-containing protein pof1-like isoform X2 [Populus euphratica]
MKPYDNAMNESFLTISALAFALRDKNYGQIMASLDSPNSPPNPSFAIRETAAHKLLRSISIGEAPSFSHFPCSPSPRLSTNSNIHTSPIFSSPPRQGSCTPVDNLVTTSESTNYAYRCLSSVLKRDGQILSMAMSNSLIYSGSSTNIIRLWKLPEFSECGQLKTKARMVVALQVSHDRVYAAYADGKIRIWRRTWDGAFKHIRLATIPSSGGYVRSLIYRKDKMMKHVGPITSLAINLSDDIIYSASLDRTVKVWRISDLKCIETIHAHLEPVNAIVVADDGILYTASDDASIRVWRRNFCSGEWPHSLTVTLPSKHSPGWFPGQLQYGGALQGHTHAIMCMANVSKYVISGSADSTSRVWGRDSDGQHTCLAVLVGHRGPIRCVTAFLGRSEDDNEDGCTICTGSLDGVLKLWRVTRTNKESGNSSQNASDYFDL